MVIYRNQEIINIIKHDQLSSQSYFEKKNKIILPKFSVHHAAVFRNEVQHTNSVQQRVTRNWDEKVIAPEFLFHEETCKIRPNKTESVSTVIPSSYF